MTHIDKNQNISSYKTGIYFLRVLKQAQRFRNLQLPLRVPLLWPFGRVIYHLRSNKDRSGIWAHDP